MLNEFRKIVLKNYLKKLLYSAQEKERQKKRTVTQCHAFIGIGYGGGAGIPTPIIGHYTIFGHNRLFLAKLNMPIS